MKYQFIADYREAFESTVRCRVVVVSGRDYSAWTRARKMADQELKQQIKDIHP